MTLVDAKVGEVYKVKRINTEDPEMESFLFRLGCYSGEPITVISKKRSSCIVSIKNGRYNIDKMLANAVEI